MKYGFVKYSLAALLAITAWLFWWQGHPELVSFHEQNQLFLFTSDYLTERLGVAGGLADYLCEFLVQFFYYIGSGSAIIGLVLAALYVLLLLPSSGSKRSGTYCRRSLPSPLPC